MIAGIAGIDAGEAIIGGLMALIGGAGVIATQWINRADERKRQADPYLRRCPK